MSDNGKGFDAVMVRRGNGLENNQKMADEIGAILILQSKENDGPPFTCNVKSPGEVLPQRTYLWIFVY